MMNLATASHHNRLSALRFIMIQLSLPLLNLDGDDPPVSDVMVGGGQFDPKSPVRWGSTNAGKAEKKRLAKEGKKRCSRCKEIKEYAEFSKAECRWDGLNYRCKSCDAEYRDRPGARVKQLEYTRKHYKENQGRYAELARKWQSENRARHLAYRAKRRQQQNYKAAQLRFRNSEAGVILARVGTQRVTSRRLGLKTTLTAKGWRSICKFWGTKCAYCQKTPHRMECDHVVPKSLGGGFTPQNIVPACRSCNRSKSSSNVREWMEYKGLDYERFQLKLQQQREEIF